MHASHACTDMAWQGEVQLQVWVRVSRGMEAGVKVLSRQGAWAKVSRDGPMCPGAC